MQTGDLKLHMGAAFGSAARASAVQGLRDVIASSCSSNGVVPAWPLDNPPCGHALQGTCAANRDILPEGSSTGTF